MAHCSNSSSSSSSSSSTSSGGGSSSSIVVVVAAAAAIPSPPLSEEINRNCGSSYSLPAVTCCTYLNISSVTSLYMYNHTTKHVLPCQELEHIQTTEFVFNLHASYILDAKCGDIPSNSSHMFRQSRYFLHFMAIQSLFHFPPDAIHSIILFFLLK